MEPATLEPGPDHLCRSSPLGYRAQAEYLGEVIADSAEAVRVDETGRPPALYFPAGDVRLDRLSPSGEAVKCPAKGTATLFDGPDTPSGRGVAWRFDDPAAGMEWLSGAVAFDHDRVDVRVIDAAEGAARRDVTVKRFPLWGDASDLVDVLDVRRAGPDAYESVTRSSWSRPVVEGSQMLGQAIVAAGRHAPGRRVVSAHMVFLKVATTEQPLRFVVDPLSGGRTMTGLRVDVWQGTLRCASGTVLLDVTAPDVIRHSCAPPAVTGPYENDPFDMSVTGRDIRMVDGGYDDDPAAPPAPPVIDSWVRFRTVPDDAYLNAGLLAQYTGHIPIAAALRPHAGISQRQAHVSLSTGINAIAISFHRDVRADEWMLYHHLSTFAGDGMTHSECRVHDLEGRLLASFSVDAMVRAMSNPEAVSEGSVL